MQPYQSYLPQMNNQQMTNPYVDRMNFLQGYQQNLQQPMAMPQANQPMAVSGKIVDSVEVVKATDVPMDGNMYYFPKADGSEIFGKQWIVTEGRTQILTFKPILEGDNNNLSGNDKTAVLTLSEDVTGAFMQRFDNLEKQINDLINKSTVKSANSKAKKDGADNE